MTALGLSPSRGARYDHISSTYDGSGDGTRSAKPVVEARNMTTRRNSYLALATQPVRLVSVIAQTAHGITQTYAEASDRHDQRRVLLDAYVAQLAAADRQDARAHDSLRALIALAEQLVAAGLRFRYGAALADVAKESGERWADAVARASASVGRKIRPGVEAYAVEWDESAAIHWFRQEVARRWPAAKVEAAFLASDPVTLWTVCLALDLAPHRAAKFADDPFPAPPLLITGPTGIGKELLAKAVHAASGAPGPFGAINCGGLPTQLLESELFGHEKGAFTGAIKSKRGLVEEFEHGTLFLDEVGDMPAEVQVRLLRFLNNGEARKVGANQSYRAFPRIIAATHVDLAARAESGDFRRDLLHRLRGRHLHLRGEKSHRSPVF